MALLSSNAVLNLGTKEGENPVSLAVERNHMICLKLLLEAGADSTTFKHGTEFVLHRAVKSNNLKAVKLLVEYGADIAATNSGGLTCLLLAAKNKQKELLSYFLEQGSCPVNLVAQDGSSALHCVVLWDDRHIISLLIDKGADINAQNQDGETPLFLATKHNRWKALKALLRADADRNLRSMDGENPVSLAVKLNHMKCLEALLQYGACLNVCTQDAETVLHRAVRSNNIVAVKLLVEHGADVEALTADGFSCLILAAKNKQFDLVSYFITNCSCDVNALGQEGFNLLHYAALFNRPEIVVELVFNRADVNAKTACGRTAVYLAVVTNMLDSLKELLENGADPNIEIDVRHSQCYHMFKMSNVLYDVKRDCHGITGACALHEAVSQGNIESVKLLLKHGATIAKTRSDGLTPLDIALSLSPPRPDIVESFSNASMVNEEIKKLMTRCELTEQMLQDQMTENEKEVALRVDTELQLLKLQSELEKYSNRTELAEQTLKALLSEVEDCIHCPITCAVMEDPVTASDGHTYERSAIEQWLTDRNDSPITRQPITVSSLISTLSVKSLIERYNRGL
eukprot:g6624.t1